MSEVLTAEQVRAEREASLARRGLGAPTQDALATVAPSQDPAPEPVEEAGAGDVTMEDERAALRRADIPFAVLWPLLHANRHVPLAQQILEAVVVHSQQQLAYLHGKMDGIRDAVAIMERHAAAEALADTVPPSPEQPDPEAA